MNYLHAELLQLFTYYINKYIRDILHEFLQIKKL